VKRATGIAAALAALAFAGCGQLDLTPEGNPSRVLVGSVELENGSALPADATITVRVVDKSNMGMPPQVLGSKTVTNPGGDAPVNFRVEYWAEDEVLREGLSVEVRVAYGGKIRYYNRSGYSINLGNAANTHRITVQPASE
jgi:uncharacterized lipoprotein YbaY